MSVSGTQVAIIQPLNRLSEADPLAVAQLEGSLAGDASGGTATLAFSVPDNFACILSWMTGVQISVVAAVAFEFFWSFPDPQPQGIVGLQGVIEAGGGESSSPMFVPPPIILLGGGVAGATNTFSVRCANTAVGDDLFGAGTAWLFDLQFARNLPAGLYWPYRQIGS